MKGIVFTEFLAMVEDRFGILMVDQIIEDSQLESGGSYTAVGTYDHAEMVQLVTQLSGKIDTPINDLLLVYGEHFFHILTASYPTFFENIPDAFTFLSGIENHIHVEVLKLYPDAELPRFDIVRKSEDVLEMTYHSERKLADFAHGLLNSAVQHFKEDIEIVKEEISSDGSVVRFTLTKKDG